MFNKQLSTLRIKAGLNQSELGKALGVSRSTIAMYEVGSREPGIDMLIKIANYFNVSIDYLVGNNAFFKSK